MKRLIQFSENDDNYVCVENDEDIFCISKKELEFDVKKFYDSFYGDDKDYSEIVFENTISSDKTANRIFDCIDKLLVSIKEKLCELEVDRVVE